MNDATYTYGGKELDDDTNLYYFNARYYDATTGRFINVDSIQDGSNWYVYCKNNPMNFVDPTGLFEVESPHAKNRSESGQKRGYMVTASSYTNNFISTISELARIFDFFSSGKKSRAEGGIPGDVGRAKADLTFYFSLDTFFMRGRQETIGPKVDQKTFEVYQKLFGGELHGDSLVTPSDQSYKQVRSRLGVIWGVVAPIMGGRANEPIYMLGTNMSKQEYNNVSTQDIKSIDIEVKRLVKSGELSYEK